jgi:hypothetical protein
MPLLTFSRERASNATLAAVKVTGFLMGVSIILKSVSFNP